jgi:hypothetical protein
MKDALIYLTVSFVLLATAVVLRYYSYEVESIPLVVLSIGLAAHSIERYTKKEHIGH